MTDIIDVKFLGEKLKKLRQAAGVSRKQLADYLGVSVVVVGQYERGERNPRQEKVTALADFFNVLPTELISTNLNTLEKSTADVIDKKIFEYRLDRAYKLARDFIDYKLNATPNFDEEGKIVIHTPKKIIFEKGGTVSYSGEYNTVKGGTVSYSGEYNTVKFKTPADFVAIMERAEFTALQRQTNFNFAFRHIVFGDELYHVIDD